MLSGRCQTRPATRSSVPALSTPSTIWEILTGTGIAATPRPLVHDLSGFRRSQPEALSACDFFECAAPYPASVSRTSATGVGSRGPMCDASGKSCTRKLLPGVDASASAIILSWSAVAIVRSLPKRR
jgi:hypothetical protein